MVSLKPSEGLRNTGLRLSPDLHCTPREEVRNGRQEGSVLWKGGLSQIKLAGLAGFQERERKVIWEKAGS